MVAAVLSAFVGGYYFGCYETILRLKAMVEQHREKPA
jgi:hypothetical protein